jgi:hypothetical protein
MSVTYSVVAPLVLVHDDEGVVSHVYQGAVLPDVDKGQVDHLLELGFIAKEGSDEAVIVPGAEFVVPDSLHVPERDALGNTFSEPEPVVEEAPKPAPKPRASRSN